MATWGVQFEGKHSLGDRLTRFSDTRFINANGSVQLSGDGTPFAFLAMDTVFNTTQAPSITIDYNNKIISWNYYGRTGTLIFGLY